MESVHEQGGGTADGHANRAELKGTRMADSSWSVALTVREPAPLVLANVAWHLGQGAREVRVFLDDPGDPVAPELEAIPGCIVTRCDEGHWAKRGGRNQMQTRRQVYNATLAYQETTANWLIHLDADEFLYQKTPLADELGHLAELPGYLHLDVRERFYEAGHQAQDIFAGGFRCPSRGIPVFDRALFRDLSPWLAKGLAGHAAGKAIVPTGRPWRVGIHAPKYGQRRKENRLAGLPSGSSVILHFDGLTRDHWIGKLQRYAGLDIEDVNRIAAPHRRAQIAMAREFGGDHEALGAFHDRLKCLNADEVARMRDLGLIDDIAFNPAPVIASVLGERTPDLSAAAFDRALGTP
ncbi:Glycosyl transferase family 2 [Poseidonocella pacifica]|uniref:Glycosyl transferase family 2 n=1 Tax=Poseidonocella pacifica TaxID=871651 RepID=A0A1I0YX09_9RHOB|nr:glycosyltransferase family 2 protein [Poseidonocella pacifica]SFB17712.1 Glycosyl transferase family 2 [Poseidonocella pacifica]